MANYQNPKTDWAAPDGVTNADMNRIEENIKYLKEDALGGAEIGTGPNKLVKTDANGKMPVSITGDAMTLQGLGPDDLKAGGILGQVTYPGVVEHIGDEFPITPTNPLSKKIQVGTGRALTSDGVYNFDQMTELTIADSVVVAASGSFSVAAGSIITVPNVPLGNAAGTAPAQVSDVTVVRNDTSVAVTVTAVNPVNGQITVSGVAVGTVVKVSYHAYTKRIDKIVVQPDGVIEVLPGNAVTSNSTTVRPATPDGAVSLGVVEVTTNFSVIAAVNLYPEHTYAGFVGLGDIPSEAWMYLLFKDQLSTEQRQKVENNKQLKQLIDNNSIIASLGTGGTTQKKYILTSLVSSIAGNTESAHTENDEYIITPDTSSILYVINKSTGVATMLGKGASSGFITGGGARTYDCNARYAVLGALSGTEIPYVDLTNLSTGVQRVATATRNITDDAIAIKPGNELEFLLGGADGHLRYYKGSTVMSTLALPGISQYGKALIVDIIWPENDNMTAYVLYRDSYTGDMNLVRVVFTAAGTGLTIVNTAADSDMRRFDNLQGTTELAYTPTNKRIHVVCVSTTNYVVSFNRNLSRHTQRTLAPRNLAFSKLQGTRIGDYHCWVASGFVVIFDTEFAVVATIAMDTQATQLYYIPNSTDLIGTSFVSASTLGKAFAQFTLGTVVPARL